MALFLHTCTNIIRQEHRCAVLFYEVLQLVCKLARRGLVYWYIDCDILVYKVYAVQHLAFLCMSVLFGRTKNTITNSAAAFHSCFPFSTRSG